MNWLEKVLSNFPLEEETEEYILGRGGKKESIQNIGICTWDASKISDIQDAEFVEKYGNKGQRIDQCMISPYWSTVGSIIGFEARSIKEKWISDFRLVSTKWLPVWIGSRYATQKLWEGGSAWVCEGIFDAFALEWVIPPKDVTLATVQAKFTKMHLEYIRRYGTRVQMVYDMDATGRKGSKKACYLLDQAKIPYHEWVYPKKDPGILWDLGGQKLLIDTFKGY
jgi:DNA primase